MSVSSLFASLPGSLLHPILMMILFPLYLLTLYLGIQARQRRVSPSARPLVPRIRKAHHKLAAFVFLLTVAGCFLGMANTYTRVGRLFPGPHLYRGLLLVLLGACNVALVPWFMNYTSARLPHAIIGGLMLLVFLSQIQTGFHILKSVWAKFHP